ncbi:MAG: alpha/beta hydrolase [Planctomycetaceae bacterium]|nr:alpha/beta hydrolase [Planctomycetaceae bacterium]
MNSLRPSITVFSSLKSKFFPPTPDDKHHFRKALEKLIIKSLVRSLSLGLMMITFSQFAQTAAAARDLSEAELTQLLERFPAADVNGDGQLTQEEAEQFRQVRNAKKQSARDENSAFVRVDVDSKNSLPKPTLANVAYGSHERQVLDFYRTDSVSPTPIVIYFHGGGFRGGDKGSFAKDVQPYLDAGISVVSSNYRYSSQAIYPGPMQDGARAVQFVRSKAAAWNLDPEKLTLSGSSAGGLLALWIAWHDDMADPASTDPVARQSTRVNSVVTYITAGSIEPEYVYKHFGVNDFGAVLPLFGVKSVEELSRPDKAALVHDASPLNHLSPDDPPVLSIYRGQLTPTPLPADTRFGQWIHHPKFGELLKQACDAMGVEYTFYHAGNSILEGAEVTFVEKHVTATKKLSPSLPENELPPERVIYKSTQDRDLRMLFTFPPDWKSNDHRSAIVFFFNGGWNPDGASQQFQEQTRYFAERGLVAVRADYREKSSEGVTSTRCIEDTFSALRFLRSNAHRLGIDPEKVAAAGGSGSIHLAAAELFSDEISAEGEDRSISPRPQALFLYHPDVDVLNPEVLPRMLDGRSSGNLRATMPPVMVLYGSQDVLAPHLDDIVGRAQEIGLPFEKFVGEGGLHGFYKFSPWLEKTTEAVDQRLIELGILKHEPFIELPQKTKPAGLDDRILSTQSKWTERHDQLMAEGKSGMSRLAEIPRKRLPRQETHVYKKLGDRRLTIIVHKPVALPSQPTKPAILFMEGGVMNPKDKDGNFYPLAEERARRGMPVNNRGPGDVFTPVADYFAQRGMVAMRVEVRKRSTDGALPEDAIADGAAAVRWVRENARSLGVDPSRVVVAGSSGGSHVAASVYALDDLTSGPESSTGNPNLSCKPDVIILYSPLVDWIDPGPMGKRFMEALDDDRDRAIRLSPARHWRDNMPPTLILLGEREPIFNTVNAFATQWSEAGKPMELFIAEGAGHAFASKSPWTERATERVDAFLKKHSYLEQEPRVPLPYREKPPRE